MSCNWDVGSNDYIKANSTNDCPDSDAEYAYLIHLADTTEGSLFEGTLDEDATPDARGDAAFVHSDCIAYYGASSERYNRTIGTGTGPRPDGGTNCDPYVIDGFNNSVDLTVGDTPAGSVTINGGAQYSSSSNVTLTLSASDANGVTDMRFSNTGNGADWVTVSPDAPSASWTLAPGEGTRTVYAQFKDPAGHWGPTTPATDSITVDLTPAFPSPPDVTCAPVAGAVYQAATNDPCYFRPAAASTIALTATAADAVSGIEHIRFENLTPAANWMPPTPPGLPNLDTSSPYQQSLGFTAATGSATIGVTAKNGADLDGATRTVSLTPDTTPPTAAITAPEANRPLSGTVTVTGTATDTILKEYRLEYGAGTSPTSWTAIGTFTTAVPAGTLGTWAPGSLSGVYTIRLTATDQVGNSSQATRTVVLENGMRGDEAYYTRVPYDLGGGLMLDVGVGNGEARLTRDLFSIPSHGPAQELSLAYSSADADATGRFGVGWSSNLTQYLTFDLAGAVTTWHRSDGGRVPFGNVAGTWTAGAGHYETMTVAGSEVTITAKDQTRFVFESSGAGRLKRIENRFGKALTITWSASGATVTDASGRGPAQGQSYNIAYDSANARITGFTDFAGRTWTFNYTGAGTSSDLTCITDPVSKVTRLTYTAHTLTKVSRDGATCSTDGAVTWSVGYAAGKVASVTTPEVAHPDLFTYATGSATWREVTLDVTATEYADTAYTLDPAGRGWVTATASPEGALVERTFDGDGNIKTETSPDDLEVVVTFDHDTRGNLTREERVLERPDSNDPDHLYGLVAVTRYTYSAANDVLTRTDADNDAATRTVTRYDYDPAGHLVSENRNCTSSGTTIPGEGQGGGCTGGGTQDASTNVITRYAYTTNDQLASEQDPRGFVTKHLYDTHGNERAVIANCTSSGTVPPSPFDSCTAVLDAGGSSLINAGTRDASTNVLTLTAYDTATAAGKAGLPTSATDAVGRTTTYGYDLLGRQEEEVLPGDATTVPALTRTTPYDEFGNAWTESESWTPLGAGEAITLTTAREFDREQREISVIDPTELAKTTTTYDPQGNQVEQVVRNVAGTIIATTTGWTYDKDGNQASEVLVGTTGSATLQTATYTPSSLLHSATSGTTTQMATLEVGGAATVVGTYASNNLLVPLSTTETVYDTLGNATSTTSEIGTVTTSTFDRLGRLLTTTTEDRTTTYTYDRAGNQLSVADPTGVTTTTAYDALGRATAVIVNDVAGQSTLPGEDVTTATWYDAAGNTVAVTDALGITTRSILNARDQVRRTIANCTDSGTTPTSDPATCTGEGTHDATTNVITDTTFDGQGNVIRTVAAVGLGTAYETTTETAYEAAGRVQAAKDAMGTITRSVYNEAGQLTDTYVNCTTTGTTIPSDWATCSGGGTADGTYNLHTHYGYDAWGNQAAVTAPNGRETRLLYDTSNRLTATIDNYVNGVAETTDGSATDDVTTEYLYDGAGRQAAVRTASPTGSGTTITRTIFNDDGSVAQVIVNCTTSGTAVPASDAEALACTGAGTRNADTNLTTSSTYDPEGRLVAVTAPDPSATTGTATVTTRYAYDAAGRLCRVLEASTITGDAWTAAGCTGAISGTASANTSTRYGYDALGNLTSMTDARGNTTTYGYDAAGHMTSRTDAMGGDLVWTYDALGNQVTQRNRTDDGPAVSVTWTHDPYGRILSRTADGTATTSTYDLAGNRLSATTGAMTITATYDRLGRVLTVDDEDAGTTPDTSYTWTVGTGGVSTPAWTDPTGSYTATLDAFDRPVAMTDPVSASGWAWTYGTSGQVTGSTHGNGNTVTSTYDAAGRELIRTTKTGGTTRAAYTWTHNRAGLVLSEASTITGDPANGTIGYAYDPLGRLTGSGATTYTWDATANRTGAGSSTTAFDAANRPTSGTSPTAAYQSDADGRLIERPGQTMTWDHLGRLLSVTTASGTTGYSYDPLDRLRTVTVPGGTVTRFRYSGLTTSAAQLLDGAGTVTRSIGNGWTGERLMDWVPGTPATALRYHGANAHHDTTWLAAADGSVVSSLRYDPWGVPRSAVSTGYTPFRFQGSWHDASTDLAWVVTRWYAPSLGTFLSEDSLLGEPRDPDSRHLYAYAAGEPVGSWDPVGQYWYKTRAGDTLKSIAAARLLTDGRWPMLYNANKSNPKVIKPSGWSTAGDVVYPDRCLWIPLKWVHLSNRRSAAACAGRSKPWSYEWTNKLFDTRLGSLAQDAAQRLDIGDFRNLSPQRLHHKTAAWTGRKRQDQVTTPEMDFNISVTNAAAEEFIKKASRPGTRSWYGWTEVCGNSILPAAVSPTADAFTLGQYVFYRENRCPNNFSPRERRALRSHEYVHILQYEMKGLAMFDYLRDAQGPSHNPYEAIGYLWQAWTWAYGLDPSERPTGQSSWDWYWRPSP